MDIEAELDRVFCNLKNSAEALEGILYQSFEIPVDHWSKEKPEEIAFPNTGDKLQDINELLNLMEKNIEQTRVNIKQFELNRFQIIKEEEFDPRYSQPLIDYEINEIKCKSITETNCSLLIKIIMNSVLLLLDSPENLQFGIDNSQWIVGKKFKGIQGIPYGTHYAHYSLKDEKYQFKQGFFFISSPEQRIIIRQWNSELEQFLTFKDSTPYIYAVEMHDFDLYLGVYPMEKHEIWNQCVQYINKRVLDKLDPIKNVTIEEYDDSDLGSNTPLHTTIFYTDIPKMKSQYSGVELTAANFDKSLIVKELLVKEYNDDYQIFLGELQYAFVKFLLGEHYESFIQWKQLVILITSCDTLIAEQTQLFIDFIPSFYHQLQQLPKDFFIDPISSNNFLQSCIKNIIELAQIENPSQLRKKVFLFSNQLISRCDRLRELCEQKFLLNVCKEDDDDEPVVVEDFNFVQL